MKTLLLLIFFYFEMLSAATIYIYIKNVNGNNVENAYVILYDDNWDILKADYTNSSGEVTFALLDYGTYSYEVYYVGDVQEFWGSEENISLQNPTLTSNFTRYWPYRYSYNTPPANVNTNEQVTYEITIKNNVSFSRNVKVELWVDRNKSENGDFHELSNSQSISSNGTKTYTFNFTPITSGTYYWKMHILSYNDGAGDYIVTDSYSWVNSFEAENNQPFPLDEGVIIYHNYSNYDAWDAKLFMYDFSTNTKDELSENWNIDHEMNAHISPDGSQIVFMGDDSGLPRDWDIYIWNIGSTIAPTNLTISNNLRDEDPKFSPDGSNIVFKQSGDIKVMNLSGVIINEITNDGSTIEESMPYYTSDGQKVLYAKGAKENSDIFIMNIDGSSNTALYNEVGIQEYYPIVIDNSSFFYTRWISSLNKNDQIYQGDFSGNRNSVSINDYYSNNSDAFPVDSDYLFFSSTRSGGMEGYDLYLGQLSTGDIWDLNDFEINSDLEDLGVCFTSQVNEVPRVFLRTKIFLEGTYDTNLNEMKTDINSVIPKTSPFSEDPRTIFEIPNDIVDWVLVELKVTENSNPIISRSVLLHKDGRIVNDDGTSDEIEFEVDVGNYYIIIKHRNHLSVMSTAPISFD